MSGCCALCGELRQLYARSACFRCWHATRQLGLLDHWLPRKTVPWAYVREEYDGDLRGTAARLGMTVEALRKQIWRRGGRDVVSNGR